MQNSVFCSFSSFAYSFLSTFCFA